MLKPMLSFVISALILFLSLTGFIYHQQSVGNYNLTSTHNPQKPNFQAILSDILGPELIEPPSTSTIKKLALLDIALLIIALASAIFMSIFAYVLASGWLRGKRN